LQQNKKSQHSVKKESPSEKWVDRSSGLLRSRSGMIDPENWGSFPFDRATPPPEKRGCCKPAKLQGLTPRKSVRWGKHSFISVIFVSVDTVFTDQKTPSSVCQKEHFTGLFEIQSCINPHHTFRCPSSEHPGKRDTPTGPWLLRHARTWPAPGFSRNGWGLEG
jgi:hypothetical protein